MYSKMQYKLLLVLSSHRVTKPATVPLSAAGLSVQCLHVLQVVGLADVERVPQHQVPQAPQRVSHGGVSPFALQPVRGQPALLLLGQVHVSPPRCKTKQHTSYRLLYPTERHTELYNIRYL